MGFVKSKIPFWTILLVGFLTLPAQAAPPVDLTDFKSKADGNRLRERRLDEDDITYSDGAKTATGAPEHSAVVRYDLTGRSRSGRNGKPVVQLKKSEVVQIIGYSKDRRWAAIQSLQGARRKSWVPRSSLQVKTAKAPPRDSKKSGQTPEDAEDPEE